MRLGAALWFWDRELYDDDRAYSAVARNLIAGKGFSTEIAIGLVNPGHDAPSSLWGCLQPLWIALFYSLFGVRGGPIYVANAVIGLLPMVSAAVLAARVGDRRHVWLAAAIVAVDPYLIKHGATLLSEPLYGALLWPALALFASWARTDGLRAPAVAGLLLALASLSRGQSFYLAVWLVGWVLAERWLARNARAALGRETAVFVLVLAVAIAPWVLRNRSVHQPPVFLDTKAGWNLYSYLHPTFDPRTLSQPPVPPGILDPAMGESVRNQRLLVLAKQYALDDPVRVLALAPAKLALMWSPFAGMRTDPALAPLKLVFVLPLELLALVGFARLGLRAPVARMFAVLLLFHMILHSLMTGGPRFRAPLDPALAVLAVGALPRRSGPDGASARGIAHGDGQSAVRA